MNNQLFAQQYLSQMNGFNNSIEICQHRVKVSYIAESSLRQYKRAYTMMEITIYLCCACLTYLVSCSLYSMLHYQSCEVFSCPYKHKGGSCLPLLTCKYLLEKQNHVIQNVKGQVNSRCKVYVTAISLFLFTQDELENGMIQ